MIVVAIVDAIVGALVAVLDALPDLTLPFGDYPTEFAELLGGALGGLDSVVPITEAATVAGWVLITYVPIVIAFSVTRWIYTHLPVIGNGG